MSQKPTYEELEQRVRELEKAEFERQLEKKALQEQVVHHRVLMDGSLDGIAIIDQKHRAVESNKRFAEMLGYTPEELVRLHTWDWEAIMTEAEIRSNFADLTKTRTTFETCHRRKDGTIYDAEVTACGAKLGDESMVLTITRDITDRKRAEEALRESEEKFRLISEQSLMAIVIVQDDRIKYANQAYLEITGYTWEEIMNWTVADTARVIHPDDRHFVMEQGRKKAAGIRDGVVTHYAYRGVTKSGEARWIEQYSKTITYGGKPANLMTFVDIHDQNLAQENLRRSEERYRELADSLPEIVFETDEKGSLSYVNRNAFDYFGYTESDFDSDLNALQMIIPEDRDRAMENMQKAIDGEISGSGEYTALRKDGSTFPILIHSKAFFRDDKPMGLRGIIIDVSDIRRAEETLRDSEERYRRLAENSPDMIYRMSLPDGKYEYVSPAATDIFGYSPEAWYENPCLIREIIHPDWHSYFETEWENLLNGHVPPTYEYKIIHKDKSVRWINQRNIFVKGDNGSPVAIEGILSDITNRKLAEEALRESEEKLRVIFDTVYSGIILVDATGTITFANRRMAEMFGHDMEEFIGSSYPQHVHETQSDEGKQTDARIDPGGC